MVSLLNGLSSMGAGVASFAGTAGLEQQKSDLLKQQTVLANQLAHTSRSQEIEQQGTIAAAAAGAEHQFLAGQGDLQRQSAQAIERMQAGATLGAAGEYASATMSAAAQSAAASKYAADLNSKNVYAQIASAQPEQQARILAQQQQTAFNAVQTQNASDLRSAHADLQAAEGESNPDPVKIASLKAKVTSLEVSAGTEASITMSAATMYRTDMDNVTHLNTQITAATAALNAPEMSDTDRQAQKGLIANLKLQMVGAQRALDFSSNLVHGRVAAQTSNPAPGGPGAGNRPPLSSFGGATPPPNAAAGPRVPPPAAAATIPSLLNPGVGP